MSTCYFSIAGFLLAVSLPDSQDVGRLLPSFRPFRTGDAMDGDRLFTLSVVQSDKDHQPKVLLEESDNDMGHLRLYATPQGYRVEIVNGEYVHSGWMDKRFTVAEVHLQWEDKSVGLALSSMVRLVYAQSILYRDALSIHAASVYCGGLAYLFLGKSGTGKSTHASLWMANVPGASLLNDDNPTVRMIDGKAYAYGTPWSGKLPCYKRLSFPVGGMVRLSQSGTNCFRLQEDVDAFIALYPGCSVIGQDADLLVRLHDILVCLVGVVPVATLDCRPDREAAMMCYRAFLAANAKEESIINN